MLYIYIYTHTRTYTYTYTHMGGARRTRARVPACVRTGVCEQNSFCASLDHAT